MSKATERFESYMAQLHTGPSFPCCHGHIDCATVKNGPCCDEMFSDLTEDEQKEVS